jgi:hypothetical protein
MAQMVPRAGRRCPWTGQRRFAFKGNRKLTTILFQLKLGEGRAAGLMAHPGERSAAAE